MSKDIWLAELDRILEEVVDNDTSKEEATEALIELGLDKGEAADMIQLATI